MRLRWRDLWWLVPVFCVSVGLWWDNGGQHWLAFQTGTLCGSTGERYCYWSGFGSVLPWALLSMGGILTGVVVAFRHVNCHVKGCPRVGRFPLAGGEFKVCGHHHPGWEGKHPTQAHMLHRHSLHIKRLHDETHTDHPGSS